jgi:hypothetical protein
VLLDVQAQVGSLPVEVVDLLEEELRETHGPRLWRCRLEARKAMPLDGKRKQRIWRMVILPDVESSKLVR